MTLTKLVGNLILTGTFLTGSLYYGCSHSGKSVVEDYSTTRNILLTSGITIAVGTSLVGLAAFQDRRNKRNRSQSYQRNESEEQ